MRRGNSSSHFYFLSADYSGKVVQGTWRPNIDIYETDAHVVVALEVAGVLPEDLCVMETDRGVLIRGKRRAEPPQEPRHYHQIEMITGEFEREVLLGGPLRGAPVEATLSVGILSVRISKKVAEAAALPRKIEIEAK